MAEINPALETKLRDQPDSTVHLIVRLAGPPPDAADQVRALGLDVRRQFRLIPALAVSGPAHAGLSLLDQPWVDKIEEDHEVHTLRP